MACLGRSNQRLLFDWAGAFCSMDDAVPYSMCVPPHPDVTSATVGQKRSRELGALPHLPRGTIFGPKGGRAKKGFLFLHQVYSYDYEILVTIQYTVRSINPKQKGHLSALHSVKINCPQKRARRDTCFLYAVVQNYSF